jgi:hypothetical protein
MSVIIISQPNAHLKLKYLFGGEYAHWLLWPCTSIEEAGK